MRHPFFRATLKIAFLALAAYTTYYFLKYAFATLFLLSLPIPTGHLLWYTSIMAAMSLINAVFFIWRFLKIRSYTREGIK